MALERQLFRSRVARRFYLLFLLCALIPVTALSSIAWLRLSSDLETQARERLRRSSREAGLALTERILMLQDRLEREGMEASRFEPRLDRSGRPLPSVLQRGGFLAVRADAPAGAEASASGASGPSSTIRVVRDEHGAKLWIGAYRVDPATGSETEVWGLPEQDFLWWGPVRESTLPDDSALMVFDAEHRLLYDSSGYGTAYPGSGQRHREALRWTWEERPWLGSSWSLTSSFGGLVVVVGETEAGLFAPISRMKTQFALILLAALWIVALASSSQIRRSLVPLEKLRQATEWIAARRFDRRVEIDSDDEFADLGRSFNAMSATLGHQFRTLRAIQDVGESVHEQVSPEDVVAVMLERVDDVVDADCVAVLLFPDESAGHGGVGELHRRELNDASRLRARDTWAVAVRETDLDELRQARETCISRRADQDSVPAWLALAAGGCQTVEILPITIDRRQGAALVLGFEADSRLTVEHTDAAVQLAHQCGVALSNARLVSRLESLSLGTLRALARAVDAKSPWTSGHSERVADIGRRIGVRLGLSDAELDLLYRGGLLHDVGKIGVPNEILEKPGRLTSDEARIMQMHPELGVRILEPIPGFEEVLPIVWEHHEWWNGEGYPRGLAGEQLSLYGRIFAIADVFDALRSARPYRAGLALEKVMEIFRDECGTHFDPEILPVFLEMAPELRSLHPAGERHEGPVAPALATLAR